VGVFDRRSSKPPTLTTDELGRSFFSLAAGCAEQALHRFAGTPTLIGLVAPELYGRELIVLYAFAADTWLFEVYGDSSRRSEVMQGFWEQYEEDQTKPNGNRALQLLSVREAQNHLVQYALPSRAATDPLLHVGMAFATLCNTKDIRIALPAGLDFSLMTTAVSDFARKYNIVDAS